MRSYLSLMLLLTVFLLISTSSCQTQENQQEQSGRVTSYIPEQRPFSEELLAQLKVPGGFKVNVFAKNLENPRMIAVNNNGAVYITQPDQNNVVRLQDTNNDGISDQKNIVASGLKDVHGITIRNNYLYLATPTELFRAPMNEQGNVGQPEKLPCSLPPGGRHPNRTIAFGPDDMLYVSVGSSCDACVENNPKYASILRMNPDGTNCQIYATGLRNTIGFDWHPVTGQMWGMDQGSDWRGADIPPEELNRIEQGGNYGWPWCYGKQQVDKMIQGNPEGTSKEEYCIQTKPSALTYQAHSSPIGFIFYTGSQFPEEYNNDAFQVFRGSWNRQPPVGYKVARIHFERGQPVKFEDFLTGFLIENKTAQFARLAGIAIAKDGSLLVSDDQNGVIYRISYKNK